MRIQSIKFQHENSYFDFQVLKLPKGLSITWSKYSDQESETDQTEEEDEIFGENHQEQQQEIQ